MRVGVVSDSHGEIENLRKAGRWLIDKQNVEVIVHLGDNYDDAYTLENLDVQLIKVPGVFSNYYKRKDIPNRIIETFNDIKVLITHTECCHENDIPGDLKPEELVSKKGVDVILYGHSHIPRIEQKHSILYINPGHLKTEDKKGYPSSFAVVDFDDRVSVSIFNLMGELVQSEIFNYLGEI
jgi:putative phosphoesterase